MTYETRANFLLFLLACQPNYAPISMKGYLLDISDTHSTQARRLDAIGRLATIDHKWATFADEYRTYTASMMTEGQTPELPNRVRG